VDVGIIRLLKSRTTYNERRRKYIFSLLAHEEALFPARRIDRHTCFSVSLGNDLFKSYYILINSDAAMHSVNSSVVNDEECVRDLGSPWPLQLQ
jgi:hypothetical protein